MTLFKGFSGKFKGQKGISLVETLVAVAILATAVVTFVAALSTGALAVNEHDGEMVAQRLAQSQIEYIKSQAFSPGGVYAKLTEPTGYTIDSAAAAVTGADGNLQKITVTIRRGGAEVFRVSDYKVNR
jgi:type II secretory pathway pseudopilin PulG